MTGVDAEVGVVGLGAIGSMTVWSLARRGVDVLGLEQFWAPHDQGASAGESRLLRSLPYLERHPEDDEILAAAGVFMFGFTYLYVGINNLAGYEGTGLGWYSAWVALVAAGFAVVNLVRFDDAASALLWAQWSVLWASFFAVIALGKTQWTAVVGWLTLIMGFTTCTVPAFVYLLGEVVPAWALGVSIVATAAVLAPPQLQLGRVLDRHQPLGRTDERGQHVQGGGAAGQLIDVFFQQRADHQGGTILLGLRQQRGQWLTGGIIHLNLRVSGLRRRNWRGRRSRRLSGSNRGSIC